MFSHVFLIIPKKKQGMQACFLCFFNYSRIKRSLFSLKIAPLSWGPQDHRNRRPLAGTLRTPETSIFATPLAESNKNYLQEVQIRQTVLTFRSSAH